MKMEGFQVGFGSSLIFYDKNEEVEEIGPSKDEDKQDFEFEKSSREGEGVCDAVDLGYIHVLCFDWLVNPIPKPRTCVSSNKNGQACLSSQTTCGVYQSSCLIDQFLP